MDLVIVVSLLVSLVGLVAYALAAGKPMEIGRLAFACGLLAFLLRVAGEASLRIH